MATTSYVPPQLCLGDWQVQNDCSVNADSQTINNYVAESIEIAGAQINVFKLLGVHEQGLLVDLTGQGYAISSGAAAGSDASHAFDISNLGWTSAQQGNAVVTNPAYVGYFFGNLKTSYGTQKYSKPEYIMQHITTIQLQQSANANQRALQIRVDRSDGSLTASSSFIGTGDGVVSYLQPGFKPAQNTIVLVATSATTFSVLDYTLGPQPSYTVGQPYASKDFKFAINVGSIPFAPGDTFTISSGLAWLRADVVNVPNDGNLNTINLRASAPAPYWRIVPTLFAGTATDMWEVVKLAMMDYQATSLDNIQDTLLMENRDRDYSTSSIMLKCTYQPFDSIGDVGKFGFNILDQYIFQCSFARMVQLLGRPIVVGDIIEVTPELAYDRNLRPVKKYLEVMDCGWGSEGFTPQWQPTLYRFQAQQLIPSQENRDIIKPPQEQLYTVSDGTFFENVTQVQTEPYLATKDIAQQARIAVPETGGDPQEIASAMAMIPGDVRGSNDGTDIYVEDGMPPNGAPYEEGYVLPTSGMHDGDYYRLNYPDELQLAARLYQYNSTKGSWIYLETDRRQQYSSMRPSLRNALINMNSKSIKSSDI